jgi:hypothetical protein
MKHVVQPWGSNFKLFLNANKINTNGWPGVLFYSVQKRFRSTPILHLPMSRQFNMNASIKNKKINT